jgi:hypothetical protein
MNLTIRGKSARVAALMALISVLFMLAVAFAVQQVAATGDRDARPASNAKVSSLTEDPYIERHAEIIARYHGGSLR